MIKKPPVSIKESDYWQEGCRVMKIIGIDIGTSGLKLSIYDEQINILKSDSQGYTVHSPSSGIVELDPNIIWDSLKETVNRLFWNSFQEEREYVMSFSFLGDALIVTDEYFNPITNSILSSDTRSAKYSNMILGQLNKRELYLKTGRIPHSMLILNRLLWFKDYHNDYYRRARWYLDYPSWILAKLGFDPATDYSSASGMLFFDINKKCYDDEILKWAKIPKHKLPHLIPSGKYLGNLSEKVKSELGFPVKSRVRVVSGGMDQICNALGTGTVLPNQMVCSIGTVEATTTILPDDIDNEQLFAGNYFRSVSVFPEQFVTFSFLWAGGGSLRWYKDTLGYYAQFEEEREELNGKNLYESLIGKEIKPSKEIFLPYLAGTGPPFWNSLARGVFLGLNLASNEQNFVDSILEGVSYDLRYNLEQLQKAGIKIEKICVVGGGSRSSKWLQIKSDIVKKPLLRLERQEGGSLGAALLAGYGIGLFNDLADTAKKVNKIDKMFFPSGKYENIYDSKYKIFKESYIKLRDINKKINSFINHKKSPS